MSKMLFTPQVRSVLLYLEECLVNDCGRVEAQRLNREEMKIMRGLKDKEFIDFGRLSMRAIQKLRGNPRGQIFTHWVRFSDEAWKLTHQFRKERSDRMIGKNNTKLLREMT